MEQIDIMPKMVGSGEQGTQELLSVGKPLLAALNLTPIGRGIMGAVATMATIPEESEAGIFGILPKLARRGRVQLVEDGAAVFPDMTRNVEFPTSGMGRHIDKKGRQKLTNLADAIQDPDIFNLDIADAQFVQGMKSQLSQIPVFARDQAKMLKSANITENTNAFYSFPNPTNNLPFGKIAIKFEQADGTLIDTAQMAASATHEFTHGADMLNPTITKILSENNSALDYNFNLGENRAFIAGSRQGMYKDMTEPSSPDFLHPMLSYGGGKVSVTPGLDYINNIRHSYKAIGKKIDEQYIDDYLLELREERVRMQIKVDNDPKLRYRYDIATQDISPSNQQWIFDNPQKVAHSFRQEELANMRAIIAKRKQDEIDAFNKANPNGVTYTEPGYGE